MSDKRELEAKIVALHAFLKDVWTNIGLGWVPPEEHTKVVAEAAAARAAIELQFISWDTRGEDEQTVAQNNAEAAMERVRSGDAGLALLAELEALRLVAKEARPARFTTAGGEGGPKSWAFPELRDAFIVLDNLKETT